VQDRTVVVVAGGAPLHPDVGDLVAANVCVLAADGGLANALALGLRVDTVIGDLDSASSSDVEEAVSAGARLERHPKDKDATDLELALDAALELAPGRVLVLAGGGGRLDHLFSAFLLLGAQRCADITLDAQLGVALVHVIREERELLGETDELVSLLAVHGPAHGVRTEGLAYPLAGETLEPGSSRGISNRFVGREARVSVERGVVLAVRPGPETGGDEPK
jgi:thiamine pyrophosphokinase